MYIRGEEGEERGKQRGRVVLGVLPASTKYWAWRVALRQGRSNREWRTFKNRHIV